jgi:hypothetical protein
MANSGLARMAKRALTRLDAQIREDVEVYQGQVFIWDRKGFEELVGLNASDAVVSKLVSSYRTQLKQADKNILRVKSVGKRLATAKLNIISKKIEGYDPSRHEVYAVYNFGTAERIKRNIGSQYEKLTGRDSKEITGRLDKGDRASEAGGVQVGHGEFGHAVSTTKVLGAESVMKTKTSMQKYSNTEGYKRLESHITTYKERMNVNLSIDHYQEVSARGKLKKTYTPILSSQGAGENLLDAMEEREALAELRKSMEEEYLNIVDQEGSRSLLQAIDDTTTYTLIKGVKIAKYKGDAKPKKVVKSKGRGKTSKTIDKTAKVGVIKGTGAPAPKNKRKTKRSSTSIVNLIGIFNQQLPKTVAKNMQNPALQYQTGRFASSVRVTDINQTQQGFPSIGYTYMRNPYETFEVGNRQGTIERDPRRLIEKSIREIATGMAIGRFYTRRN